MENLWKGIAIAGIWLGNGLAVGLTSGVITPFLTVLFSAGVTFLILTDKADSLWPKKGE